MADIRIKDLTTTASSTASDDFIAVDGTTNGTRKLNAFSPTFGGNATVTGTLTGNSTITAAGNIKSSLSSSGATAGILIAENSAAAATGNQASVFLPTSTGASTYWQLNARQNSATLNDQTLRVVFGGVAQHTYFNASDLSVQSGITLKVLDTTASTTTSSGALVVSGGVGVAGAGFFGGNIVAAGNVVCGSATNQAVSIAGGTANDGGNVIVYGSTHASDPNTGRIRVGTTTITSWDSNDFTIASGKGLKVGNAYVAGAPTATGYIVIKDSTGTSYKIPAVAL